ncbi:hypothetical protein RCO48_06860 [Peribacillus frigoritolerans]|nr:hypothetical protein [Peribacillus frigoritolerans]
MKNLMGMAIFLAEECGIGQTKMTGCLAITAKGAKAPIVNVLNFTSILSFAIINNGRHTRA